MGGIIFLFKNFIFVLLIFSFISFAYQDNKPLFCGVDGTYCFYTNTSVSSDFISVDSSLASTVKKGIKNLQGESVCFKLDKGVIEKILKEYKAKCVVKECGKDFYTEYYYSNKIPYNRLIGGVKVNLQVAYSQNTAVVGSPIIYGSF